MHKQNQHFIDNFGINLTTPFSTKNEKADDNNQWIKSETKCMHMQKQFQFLINKTKQDAKTEEKYKKP